MCVRIIVHNCHTTQHRTVLIIFSLILQTIIIAQMMSNGGEGEILCSTFPDTHAHMTHSDGPHDW